MSDTSFIALIGIAAVIVVALFIYSNRQKRKFEDERAARRAELDRIKAEARARVQNDSETL